MSRRARLLLGLTLGLAGASSQEAPNRIQLRLPDFFETPFSGGAGVIELPDRPIQRLEILVVGALERNIPVSGIRVSVNGNGVTNIFSNMAVAQGTMLAMDPASLKKRPDEVFDSRENTIEVVTSDKRGRTEYQSWILRTSGSRNAYFAYSSVVSPDDPKGSPPDLVLQDPRVPPVLPANQASARIAIKGTCSSAYAPVQFSINGLPPTVMQKGVSSFQQSVEVRRGMREVVLEATDARHHRRKIVIPIVTPNANVPRPRVHGSRYALVIGVSRYGTHPQNPPPLPYAAVDAANLARELETGAGFPKQNIRLLVDDQATLSQIKLSLRDFVAKAEADDMLLVYVAARGMQDSRAGRSGEIYIAPRGAMLSQIDSTALSFDDIEMLLSRSVRCNQTFLFFDVGHEVEGDWRFPGSNLVNNRLLNLFSEQQGRAVLVSGSASQVSRQSSAAPASGAFTHWLARGLAGDADLNRDRVVTADELFRFVSEKVGSETGGAQTPRYRLPARNTAIPLTSTPGGARARPAGAGAADVLARVNRGRVPIGIPAARGFLASQEPATAQTPSSRGVIRSQTSPSGSAGKRRVALVIGNARYPLAPLRNPTHDAEDVKAALEGLGFAVNAGMDLTLSGMRQRIKSFVDGLRGGDTAFFFYAGHGMQIEGQNLLVPVDFDTRREDQATANCVVFDDVQRQLEKSPANTSILVMDACRNNPYRRARGWGRGMAPAEAGLGSYVAFSASPGHVADDTPNGRNSVFTKNLLDTLKQPPALSQLFRLVRDGVWRDSEQTQRPFLHDQLIGDFQFLDRVPQTAPQSVPASGDEALLENGRRLYLAGKCGEARQQFDLAIRANPASAFAQNAAGMAYACEGLHATAVERFKMAIRLDPAMASAYLNRGLSYMADGKYQLAAEDFSWAIDEEPQIALYYTRRGRAYFLSREYESALADFNRAAELNPADAEAFHGRGQVRQRQGDYRAALEDYNRALALKPGFREAAADRSEAEKRLPNR